MKNKEYIFGQNAQESKALKIASCFNNDLSKSELGYAFSNSNPDMNSLKFNKKGTDLIKMFEDKKTTLQAQIDAIEVQRAAIKEKLIEAGIVFQTPLEGGYERAIYDCNSTPDDIRSLCYTFNDTYGCQRLMQEIKTCQALIENLDEKKTYNLSTPQLLSLQKALDTDIVKGGEGSKGGKIIGHTKSGKPIYKTSIPHSFHKDFTPEEHSEAAILFRGKQKKSTSAQKQYDYSDQAAYHERKGVKEKDSKVEKAMTAEEGEGTTQKESVEHNVKDMQNPKPSDFDVKKAFEILGLEQ